jgi:hypothetical protein
MAWLNLIGTGVQAEGQYQQGRINSATAALQGIQDDRDANQAQVESQIQASGERRRAKLLRSRALAVAGKSGAGVSDPTVTNILAGIDTEGEVRALTALYEGDTTAQALRSGAQSKFRASSAYRSAGNLSAASSLAGGAYSFFDKYGSDLWGDTNPGRGGGYVNINPQMQDVNVDEGLVPAVTWD